MGQAAAGALTGESDPAPEQKPAPEAEDAGGWMPRSWFMAIAGITLTILFILTVVVPAVRSGGFTEFFVIAGIFAAILLGERWLRTR